MLTDAHCHLSFKDYSPDEIDSLLERAAQNGVKRFINIGAGEGVAGNIAALQLAKTKPSIWCTVGIHPHDAEMVTSETLAELRQMAEDKKVVAIGEIGLDFHYSHSPHEIQKKVFADFIDMASDIKKPVMIHDRDAGTQTLDILKEKKFPGQQVMIHCFTGSAELAHQYLDYGCYLSFTGIITFKKAQDLRDIVKFVPLSQIFVETDSPYLTPEPHRGKRNEPAYVRRVAEEVARVKEISLEQVAKATEDNVARFFNIE